ncbi:MAG: hypothetical protein ACI9W2_002015 [Gammaproteobacteria bacterium]
MRARRPESMFHHASPRDVLFSVRIEGGEANMDVSLEQTSPAGLGLPLNEAGQTGDQVAGDGFYSARSSVDYAGVGGGSCLQFVARAENACGVKLPTKLPLA